MSGARVLTFDPSEFVILEDAVEVDETIQRPETVRFFTLEEQETDAYEALMPKGRTTQFQRDEVRDIVSRMRELYEDHVLALPDDYALREPERGTKLPWVKPVYADVTRRPYSVADSWTPLFAPEARTAPGYYSRLIAALPKPYQTTGGVQIDVETPTEYVNADGTDPLRVLPVYTASSMVVHEDKTVEIAPRAMAGSEDVVNRLGYWLEKRPLEIPNPLADHPFLAANEGTFVPSTAPLLDVLPSLDAVLTHAVPVTSDPYRVGGPFLKLYDIQLSSIPWSAWTSRFPPVEVEQVLREKQEIPFPKADELAPSAKILEAYATTYAPGVSVREWLMRQDDGGEFVIKALLSQSIDNGSVESIPGIDLPVPAPPATTLEECALRGLTFPDFLVKGLLRKTPTGTLVCAPLELVRQERARSGYINRKPWKESTQNDIKVAQLTALRSARRQQLPVPVLAEQKTPGKPESVHRREAVAILHDPRRHPRDKLRDLEAVVKDDLLSENIYRDADGQFVLCEHTLAILSGDLERDRTFFYDVWTAKSDGWRVCKYCGERLMGVDLVDETEYNEEGFVLNRKEALETGPVFHGEGVAAYATGLKAISGLFAMDDPCDVVVFHLISLLQVLPTAETVSFFLTQGRVITAKMGKITDASRELRGVAGLAITVLLFQAHVPFLEPHRTFWSKPLSFTGFPRDTDKSDAFGVIDILMLVLENTYRGYPMALTGPMKQIVRAVLTRPDKTRTAVVKLLQTLLLPLKEIQDSLQEARALVKRMPPPEPVIPFLPTRVPESKGPASCPSGSSIFGGRRLPEIRQPPISLRRGLHAAGSREEVVAPVSVRVEVAEVPKDQIRRRLGIKGTLAKEGTQTNLLLAGHLSVLARKPLPVASVDPSQSPALLRDIAKGFVNEASQGLKLDPSKDITLVCLLADYTKARAETQRVRATERLSYIEKMAKVSDLERETNMELAKRGMAPILITLRERTELGQSATLADIGVGLPQDTEEQGDIGYANAGGGVDNGNYGDYMAMPSNEGRDPFETTLLDDPERSI